MLKRLRYLIPIAAVVLAAMAMLLALPAQAASGPDGPAPDAVPTPSLYPSPNERVGVGLVFNFGDIVSYNVSLLQAGFYSDWSSRTFAAHPNGMDYIPLIPVTVTQFPPNWDHLSDYVRVNPGAVWLVGNEPEATYQENRMPAQYADAYHQVYTFLKSVDPTAQVAIGGVILPSPLRLQWIDMVLAEYQARYGVPMPVDVWNTHMQIVNEVSCAYDPGNCWGAEIPVGVDANVGITMTLSDNANFDLFVQLIRGMRTWMNERGFRDKPLMISEYGVLLPSTYICNCDDPAVGDAIVASFMTRTMEYMLNTLDPTIGMPADGGRLVQRWMWYTLNDEPYNFATGLGFNGGLFDWRNNVYPGTLTNFGKVFSDFVAPLKVSYVDLRPTRFLATQRPGAVYSLTVALGNLGNTGASNIKMRLYDGDPGAGGVQIGSDATVPAIGIRYGLPVLATFDWTPPPGRVIRTFVAVVDPDNAISESNEANNAATFTALVGEYANRIMLPVIIKSYPEAQ